VETVIIKVMMTKMLFEKRENSHHRGYDDQNTLLKNVKMVII